MIAEEKKTVAEIVNDKPNAAIIFKKYHIDFCCKGKRPLNEVCETQGLNAGQLLQEIEALKGKGDQMLRIQSWPMGAICDFIVHNHHSYVKEILPQLLLMSERVAEVHGHEMKELKDLNYAFQELAVELHNHLEKEEVQLFPLIKVSEGNGIFNKTEWSTLLDELHDEHSAAGDLMHKIERLSNNFTCPEWACNTFRALFYNLNEFQDDLFQHIHLENNVLFPRVIQALSR